MRNGSKQGTTRGIGRRVFGAAAALAASAGLLVAATPASAAPADAVLGHTCIGSSPEFTIIANGTIPQNASWTVTVNEASYPGQQQLGVSVSTPLVQQTNINLITVGLKAQIALSSGTVVVIDPYYYAIPASGTTTLTISGYGGSDTVYARITGGTCS